jgi:hypothetical protein
MINRLMRKIYRHGTIGSLKILTAKPRRQYWNWRVREALVYVSPTEEELSKIEQDLIVHGINVYNFSPSPSDFMKFQEQSWFPIEYHGGIGGKAIILPLYMHTHHCGYSSAEHHGKGFADDEAKEYVRRDCSGTPFSRKYDVNLLKSRILDTIELLGMSYKISILRNKEEFRDNIYCHFILGIEK